MSFEDRMLRSYMAMLKRFSPNFKLKLIAKLTESIAEDYEKPEETDDSWMRLAGAWQGDIDADEILRERTFGREIPSFDE